MSAIASLPMQSFSGIIPALSPMLRADGRPLPWAPVLTFETRGPLHDQRATALVLGPAADTRAQRLRDANEIDLALPLRMSDGTTQWHVLMHAAMDDLAVSRTPEARHLTLTLQSKWSARLDEGFKTVPVLDDGVLLTRLIDETSLRLGDDWAMSQATFTVHGQPTRVISRRGQPWTTGQLLTAVGAWLGVKIDVAALPATTRDAGLLGVTDLARPLRALLGELLDAHGLVLHARGAEHFMALPRGLRVSEVSASDADQAWSATRRDTDDVDEQSKLLIARTTRVSREGTFGLVGGWDPSLQGLGASGYEPATASDFSKVRDVYRYWVLNEDGAFSSAPYNRPPFDLAGFFENPTMPGEPVRFAAPLTRSASGLAMEPVVEYSTDAGGSWQLLEGDVTVDAGRAALRLNQSPLPSGFLSAGESGGLRVRVTASLPSPLPRDRMRWLGNPFARSFKREVIDFSRVVAYRSMDASSIYASAVAAGTREADLADGSAEHEAILHEAAARVQRENPARGELTLAGVWPALVPGDVLRCIENQVVRDLGLAATIRLERGKRADPSASWHTRIQTGDES